MKPFPLFITLLLLFILINVSIFSLAEAQTYSVTVSAQVDEHLTYKQQGSTINFSTNYSQGFSLLTKKETIRTIGPTEKSFKIKGNFLLIANY